MVPTDDAQVAPSEVPAGGCRLGDMSHTHDDPYDLGLGHDLATLGDQQRRHRDRRAVLGLIGVGGAGVGAALLVGGGGAQATTVLSRAAASCGDEIPTETAGPFPGDGSNGPDVLLEDGIVRRDITTSIGTASGTAPGVALRFSLTLQDAATCEPVKGLAVYAWHCDREGRYSMYSDGVEDENYLRGVQVSDKAGVVTFRSIYPACYSGRWPHIHFEVYRSKAEATSSGDIVLTSQLALPRKPSMNVYRRADGYEASVANLERVSISSDNVFGDDDGVHQIATVTGSVSQGYRARLTVPIDL